MRKWIFRILIFGFLFVCIVFSVYTLIVDWKGILTNLLSVKFLVGLIVLAPAWIWRISITQWRPLIKKIAIVILAILNTGVTFYSILRPPNSQTPYPLLWIGYVSAGLFFVGTLLSAYFYWPGRRKEPGALLHNVPKRKSAKKNRTYVSIPLMTGTDGDASVTFVNATFQKVNESKKRYPEPDFGAWLVEQIYTTKKLMAESRGAFRKKMFCPSCETELPPELREPKQIEYELQYKDFDPFVVKITIPSVTCPQCNRVCGIDLDGSLNNHLSEAIIVAFKSENIKP